MGTVYLDPKDETVRAIVKAAFPGYAGRKFTARIQEKVRFSGTHWDEGSKRDYVLVRLADLQTHPVDQAPYFQSNELYHVDHAIPDGVVVVVLVHFRGNTSVEIIASGGSVTKLLPAPVELSEDEKTVLIATASFKPSYAGVGNYRFHEARRARGITQMRYDAAKTALMGRKLLNKAGAITPEGRNAIGSERF